jgi:hypothetical protein
VKGKKMKKLIAVLMLFGIVAGCSFDQVVQDQWGMLAIKNASRGLGYAIAQSKTTADDQAVIAAYELLTKGQLSEVAMTELLQKLQGQNPLVVFAALDLLEAMGAMINKGQGTVLDLSGIPPELWAIVEASYKQGYSLGMADKKAGVMRAVP